MASNPDRNCAAISCASKKPRGLFRSSKVRSVMPSTYSIDRSSRLSASTRSNIRQTLGETTSRAARISRWSNSALPSVLKSVFSATSTLKRMSCASQTSPIPPRPNGRRISYRFPRTLPGARATRPARAPRFLAVGERLAESSISWVSICRFPRRICPAISDVHFLCRECGTTQMFLSHRATAIDSRA